MDAGLRSQLGARVEHNRRQYENLCLPRNHLKLPAEGFLSAKGIFRFDIQASRTPPIDFALSIPATASQALQAGPDFATATEAHSNAAKKETGFQIEWVVTPSQKTSSMEAACTSC